MISINAVHSDSYTATLTGNGMNNNYTFTDTKNISGLAAGTYYLCIYLASQGFQQCDSLVVSQPADLAVYSVVNADTKELNLRLSGGSRYNIELNGQQFTTTAGSISLQLKEGTNRLSVTTDKFCQGTYEKLINISGKMVPYPDPFQSTLNLNLGIQNVSRVLVEVHSASDGKLVFSRQFTNQSGVLQLDLGNLEKGIYALRLVLDNNEKIFKILKQ